MGMPAQRALVRILVAVALSAAVVACFIAPVPATLPAIALQQPGLYRLEIALFVFYGSLLLVTPAFSGLVRGRLPVEISTRGAKFAEEAGHSALLNEERIKDLKRVTDELAEGLRVANLEIKRLKREPNRDSTEPPVGSGQ